MIAQWGAFDAQEGSEEAALLLQKTQVQCSKVWCTDKRPGRFEARACDLFADREPASARQAAQVI